MPLKSLSGVPRLGQIKGAKLDIQTNTEHGREISAKARNFSPPAIIIKRRFLKRIASHTIMSKILEDILAVKPLKSLESSYVDFDFQKFESFKIPVVTVHGRFQPPIHKNHFDYVSTALRIAEKVRILITNPEFTEAPVLEAPNRSKSESNPFTYKERVAIFRSFFKEYGVPETKFEFRPFNITDPGTWNESLDKGIPNLINIYGSWSERKLQLFKEMRYPVIRSNFPPRTDVSGTKIRTIIFSDLSFAEKEEQLIEAGYMPQAIAGLFAVLKNRQNSRSS